MMAQSKPWQGIPTNLTLKQFEEFVLPYLHTGSRGPQPKLFLHTIFNYILKLLYLGCQWKQLPIEKNKDGDRRSTTQESIVPLNALKPIGALMPFSSGLCRYNTLESTSTSVSSTAMVQPQWL